MLHQEGSRTKLVQKVIHIIIVFQMPPLPAGFRRQHRKRIRLWGFERESKNHDRIKEQKNPDKSFQFFCSSIMIFH